MSLINYFRGWWSAENACSPLSLNGDYSCLSLDTGVSPKEMHGLFVACRPKIIGGRCRYNIEYMRPKSTQMILLTYK